MNNALGQPQTIVLFGGRSEIGLAIVKQLLSSVTTHVVLAGRSSSAPPELGAGPFQVEEVAFDALEPSRHETVVENITSRVGDVDVAIVAFGILGDQDDFDQHPAKAAEAAAANFGGAMSVCLAVARRFRTQGHGHLVILSSVAGERVRKANMVYGATKAGLDAFGQGLSDSLAEVGCRVTIVRPGFVHTAMTAGRPPAPFATTAEVVAKATVAGMRAGRRIVWAPGILRWVFMILRHLPNAVWRRLPLG
ncbi:MAG: decaprenylphospho-beta-D-erythro-pentofuranosid-2-ulose 2-reductase [Ilumatobacteraceae bacterium]